MNGVPRQLIESKEFTAQLTRIGEAQAVDEATSALTWGISKCAEDFDVVPGFESIRVAKTDAVQWGKRIIPRLVIFFRIKSSHVDLLWIEEEKENS